MARGGHDGERDCARPTDEMPGVVAPPDRIEAWLEVAKPGDEFVYASRCMLPHGSAGAAWMRQLAGQGLVHLKQRPIAGRSERNYVAERSSAPLPPESGDGDRQRADRRGVDDEAALIDRVYPMLTRFARFNRPCPTDAQIARCVGASREAIAPVLAAMEQYGMIRMAGVKAPTLRMVTIVATGHRTGMIA